MKINYFLIKQVQKNFSFILVFFLDILLIVFLIFFYIQKIDQFNKQKLTLEDKIKSLKTRESLIELTKNLKKRNIDVELINQYLNSLIPNNEDFFLIITALENLSHETGFIIINYDLSLINTNRKRVSVAITGIGDMKTFLEFLKKYRFNSGRLITIDKIDYSPEDLTRSSTNEKKLYLTFYSQQKQPNNISLNTINDNDKKLILEILSKTKIIKKELNSNKEIEFPIREDPFQIANE